MASDKDITLGEFLRLERENRCITIEQVASATKIGVRTLHLLEEDQFVDLPAKPFIRGFVTSYCRFIGLEPKEVLARFEDFISSKTTERPNRESGHSGYAFEKKDGEQQGRTILLIAIVSFVVLGGLAVLFFKPSLHHHRKSHIDKLRAGHGTHPTSPQVGPSPLPSVMVLPAVALSPIPSSLPSLKPSAGSEGGGPSPVPSSAPGTNPNDPLDSGVGLQYNEIHHKIIAKILEDVWVRYQVDDRPMRKFIIRKGRQLYLRGKDKAWLQVSNLNAVSISYNGQNVNLESSNQNKKLIHGIATLIYPDEQGEKIEETLGKERPFPTIVSPKSD